jgi:putative SOS response-associated peptidase YedK
MCYRYVLQREALEALAVRFAIPGPVEWGSRYNLAPGEVVPVVRAPADSRLRGLEMSRMRWGLIPAWTKNAGNAAPPANARAESLAGRPTFRDAFRRRRCLVPASGFYEWQGPGRRRQPYLFRFLDGTPLCFAGIWESWRDPGDGRTVETCAIITTGPNELVRAVHDRMPAILASNEILRWLDPGLDGAPELARLLHPHAASAMEGFPVSTRVNNTRFDDPACLEPAAAEDDSSQLSFRL